jgi:excisionase family DNA binding protein
MAEYASLAEAAEFLCLSRKQIRELMKLGHLTCYRFGAKRGALRVKWSDVKAYALGSIVCTGVMPPPAPQPRKALDGNGNPINYDLANEAMRKHGRRPRA